jgi:mandelate racemase
VNPSLSKIRELKVRAVQIPMAHPHRSASGVIAESPLVLTDILTDDDVVGHSMVFTYTAAALKPTAELIKNLESLVVGEPLAPVEVAQSLARRFRLLGTQGIVGMALAAIDMALWDALARKHSISLTRLLGGIEKPIPAYGAVGFDGVSGAARAAEEWAKREFKGVKAKIGYPTVQQDLEVVRAIRQAVGHEMAIMVDYNQCLTPTEAVRRLHALDGEGLTWVEEPVMAHDYEGHAFVARAIHTPIQCGENWWGANEVQQALQVRASDYIMLDVMKIGGVTGWLRAAALAEVHAVPLSNHLWPEISAQLMCTTPAAHYLEYADWWNPILSEPLRVEHGMAIVGTTPGTGVQWNEKAVTRFAAG